MTVFRGKGGFYYLLQILVPRWLSAITWVGILHTWCYVSHLHTSNQVGRILNICRRKNKILRLMSLFCLGFSLFVCSTNLQHTQTVGLLGIILICRIIGFKTGSVREGRGALHSKRSPKCGILSSKLRSPVCKEEEEMMGVWQCESS